jgi:hypothetical protein
MRLTYRRSRFYLSIGYLFDLGMAIIFLAVLFCLSCDVHFAIRVKKGVGGSLPALKMLVIEKCDLLLLEKQSYSKLIRNNNNYF